MDNIFENLISGFKSFYTKYKSIIIISLVIIIVLLLYILFPKKEKIIYECRINTNTYNSEIVLSNSNINNQIELNDIININIGNTNFRIPVVDNILFLSIDDNYAMIQNNDLLIGSKYTSFKNKIDLNINEAKVEVIKKNGYSYGDYLKKNELNKVNYRDFNNDYEYISFLHLNKTNLYSANFELNNDNKLDIFEKIIDEMNIKDLIIYNMDYNDFILFIRTNDPSKHISLQNIFNENRILTIEPIDYNKIDNFYKRFNQIIKMIYNNDGPYVFINTVNNDEIVIYNIIFDALQNKNYDEMLSNFISFYKTNYKYEENDKILKNNFNKLLKKIFNLDNSIKLSDLQYKAILTDYIEDVDDLTLNYIINKLTLSTDNTNN